MKKKKISKEFIIGIFTITLFIASYFGFNYLLNKNVFGNDYTVYAHFEQAAGLENSASVIVQGFQIGTVEEVSFDIKKKEFTVRMNIGGDYSIPANSTARIASSSLLGGKAIMIDLGNDAKMLDNDGVIASSNELGLMDNAGAEYATLKENLTVLVDKVSVALDGINRALSVENTKALSTTMNNLAGASSDIKSITTANKKELSEIIENLNVVSASLSKAAPDLERGIENLAAISDAVAISAPDMVQNAAKSVENLNEILSKIKSGEGSMGKLVADEEFYNNANATLNNLAVLLEDLKANPKKYINVSVFGGKK